MKARSGEVVREFRAHRLADRPRPLRVLRGWTEFAPDSLLEQAEFELSVPPNQLRAYSSETVPHDRVGSEDRGGISERTRRLSWRVTQT
jgi:hypothetical protein